jgi:hypothetical protein
VTSGWHELAQLGYSRGFMVRPIDGWPGAETPDHARTGSNFSASLSSTLTLIAKELRALDARQVVLCIDLRERDIRNDGLPRSDARPLTPRVLLAFGSKRGEQYRGWKALPASTDPADSLTTKEQAEEYLKRWDGDLRRALKETHPDAGGDEAEFRTVVRARDLINAA